MKMARRIVVLVLFAGILSLSLAGCKKKVAEEPADQSLEKLQGQKAEAEQEKTNDTGAKVEEKKKAEHPEHPK